MVKHLLSQDTQNNLYIKKNKKKEQEVYSHSILLAPLLKLPKCYEKNLNTDLCFIHAELKK